jgi:hypothetical protein
MLTWPEFFPPPSRPPYLEHCSRQLDCWLMRSIAAATLEATHPAPRPEGHRLPCVIDEQGDRKGKQKEKGYPTL